METVESGKIEKLELKNMVSGIKNSLSEDRTQQKTEWVNLKVCQ